MNYSLKKLDNGIRVLTVPMPHLESASLNVWVGVGSRYETDEIAGISHFLEHLVYKGSKKRPTPLEVSYAIDAIGSEANAGTSREWTTYYIKARTGVLGQAFDILSDIVLDPLMEEQWIELEKGVIIEEINRKEDDPSEKVGESFISKLYEGNPLARDIAGYPKTVKKLTRDDFVRYRKSHYDAGNILITVAGGVKEKDVLKLANEYFGGISEGKRSKPIKYDGKHDKPRLHFEKKATEQSHFYLGYLGNPRDHKDKHVESMLSVIMGQGFSSRLFMEIREKRGLAYSVGSSVNRYADTGVYATYAGTDVKKTEEAIKIVLDQSYGIADGRYPIANDELIKAKEYIKGRIALALEDTLSVNNFFGLQALFYEKIETPQEMFDRIDNITSEEIVASARELFVPERLTLAVIGPHKDEGKFQKLIQKV